MKLLHIAPLGDPYTGLYYSIPSLARAQAELGAEVELWSSTPKLHKIEIPPVHSRPSTVDRRPSTVDSRPFTVDRRPSTVDRPPPPVPSQQSTTLTPPYPDLVIFHSTYIWSQIRLAAFCRREGIPYIITPRAGMTRGAQRQSWWKKSLANILFFRRMIKGARAIHCLTQFEAQETAHWGRPVFIVGNGIELPKLPEDTLNRPFAKPLLCTYIGRFSIRAKGLDILINGLVQLQQRHANPGANWQVILNGPDGPGRRWVQKQIEKQKLQSWVKIAGPLDATCKCRVLLESDLFLHPSRFEGHPMAVLEALAHGVPCLVTDQTGMGNTIEQAKAGWRIPGTPQALAEALESIVDCGRLTVDGERLTVDGERLTGDGRRLTGDDGRCDRPRSTIHGSQSTVSRPPSTAHSPPSTDDGPQSPGPRASACSLAQKFNWVAMAKETLNEYESVLSGEFSG